MLHPDWDLIVISWAELGLGTSQPDGKHAKRAMPRFTEAPCHGP